MSLVILGVGNVLMTDDGVGVHAARALAADPPARATVHEVGTAVFDALAIIEQAREVIAIDAVDAGEPPGSVISFDLDDREQVAAPVSLHAFDLPALVRLLPRAIRPRVVVIGIQPAVVEPGLDLSPAVSASLPALLAEVRALAA